MAEEKTELREILARLESVERQNRTLKRGGVVAAFLLAMMFIMGQAKPDRTIEADTVKARRIDANAIVLHSDDSGDGSILTAGVISLASKDSFISISASDGPSVELKGKDGFETDLGVTSLVTPKTGESHTTSAASVVLFGKDKKVLWSAP